MPIIRDGGARLTLSVAILISGSGCSYYHSRYFERSNASEVRIDRYRLAPRIFTYVDNKDPILDMPVD